MIITYDSYIIPLVSREGVMYSYLEFIGKPIIDDLTKYPSVHLTSSQPWDPTMLDAPNIYHSLTTDEGNMAHQLEPQKVHNRKYYQQESLIASSDPDVIKIPLQSSLCLNFYDKIFSPQQENGEQITEKGNKVLTTNFTL